MGEMMKRFIVVICFLLILHLVISQDSESIKPDGRNNEKILEAINICREKLKDDPNFPKVQHSLAQLLDSQIVDEDPEPTLINEILYLYQVVGEPPTDVMEHRIPPPSVRFQSLVRAGTIAKDILHDTDQAATFYMSALKLDDIDQTSVLALFETTLTILTTLSLAAEDAMVILQTALDLCDFIGKKYPDEGIVDEYRGVSLRRMNQSQLAFQSYEQAMLKTKRKYLDSCDDKSSWKSCVDENRKIDRACLELLTAFVKTSILVSAAAREIGRDSRAQMKYLKEAEEFAIPFLLLTAANENDEMTLQAWTNVLVDLYNNMGIVEKKDGSFPQAATFFKKALELNPSDGHALVQLASLELDDESNSEVLANVKELDPEYVGALFDGYSSRFETELVDVLHYKGHILLYESLQAMWKLTPISDVNNIVDLGCGTGLLGELIVNDLPWVELYGVDLSERMVDISRRRKSKAGKTIYSSVVRADASQYLSSLEKQSIDCVVASDVFIYIGDISAILEESSKCLVQGGLIAFTVEGYDNIQDSNGGMRLLPSGRFGHSKSYIQKVAKSQGFEVSSWRDCVLRRQGGQDVKGAVVVLMMNRSM